MLKRLVVWSVETFVFMIGSGYLVSTAIVAVFFRAQTPWTYPLIAAALFVVHEQFFLTGWAPPALTHVQVQIGGASIVFATTFIGGGFLRKWSGKK